MMTRRLCAASMESEDKNAELESIVCDLQFRSKLIARMALLSVIESRIIRAHSAYHWHPDSTIKNDSTMALESTEIIDLYVTVNDVQWLDSNTFAYWFTDGHQEPIRRIVRVAYDQPQFALHQLKQIGDPIDFSNAIFTRK